MNSLRSVLDTAGILAGEAVDARYREDAGNKPGALPELVLRPRSTAEVSAVLRLCDEHRQPLVVQGGRTGLAGAARTRTGEAVLSLERMTRVGAPDPGSASILADAGAPLQAVQEAARAAGFLLGVDIGSRGTATIGGNIATNAGGIRVLRYGMFRAQILGLEAVLADGSVLSSLRGLAKDNSGYDLGQLFVGAEGTLGVVTRACLRLHPMPRLQRNAFCALPSNQSAVDLLAFLRGRLGPSLSAYEIILGPLYEAIQPLLPAAAPLPPGSAAYVLCEAQGFDEDEEEKLAEALMAAVEEGLAADAVLSQSAREFEALWAVRETSNTLLFGLDRMADFDISVPVARIAAFLAAAGAAVWAVDREAEHYVFGHLGDGNLHYSVRTTKSEEVTKVMFGAVIAAGGSISAEHGIGLDKKRWLPLVRSASELAAMRRLKQCFDPNNILNPGRVFDLETA